MSKDWAYLRQEWLKNTSLQENDAKWALEVLIKSEKEFHEIEIGLQNNEDIYSKVRNLKKKVRQIFYQKNQA